MNRPSHVFVACVQQASLENVQTIQYGMSYFLGKCDGFIFVIRHEILLGGAKPGANRGAPAVIYAPGARGATLKSWGGAVVLAEGQGLSRRSPDHFKHQFRRKK
jgi:hypothetical protein